MGKREEKSEDWITYKNFDSYGRQIYFLPFKTKDIESFLTVSGNQSKIIENV